jgi:glyoxylase-like metal-dependent hydrolase (beta-lactamase superfamily II)
MIHLPDSISVFERGWLSSNNVLLTDDACAALVDTGYATHAPQTLALVQRALGARPLDLIVNTHLHSDHCGGNMLLQQTWPCRTAIPAAEADAVARWDESLLSFRGTGQTCERFSFTETLSPGVRVTLGALVWEVLGAPGHDPHSLILYCPAEGLLISADALWENGFGVIFPELEGESGFVEQQGVLETIAGLEVRTVIPGHGAPFSNVEQALERAFSRLAWLRADPARNAKNALKVLIVFKLLEVREMDLEALLNLLEAARAMHAAAALLAPRGQWRALVQELIGELSGVGGPVKIEAGRIVARGA